MGTPFIGELKIISWNYAPKNWAFCNGQLLPIAQNQALFSLLGTMYGGDGRINFGLPDLRGRASMHMGAAQGGSNHTQGEIGGASTQTLILGQLPIHNHVVEVDGSTVATSNTNTATATSTLGQTIGSPAQGASFPVSMYGTGAPGGALAPATIGNTGGNQPHDNMQPYLVLNYVIALVGVFPSRN